MAILRALDRKLLRDAWHLRGQLVTIALVVACGIACYVTFNTAYATIDESRALYYESQRFADVFCRLKRAPDAVAARLEALPGVAVVETREVEDVRLPLADSVEPALGRIITLHHGEEPRLNALRLREGRLPEPGRADEVVILESFAKAHALPLGSTLPAVLDGVLRDLRVVGVALSPEYVYAMSGLELIPDPARFAVLWMDRDEVAPAFRMEGAFNDVEVQLQPGASEVMVTDALDRELARYGGFGAYGRSKQLSNHILDSELGQLSSYATLVPAIFLAVAAFLLNVVLSRLVHLQRSQIATLKAVGYYDSAVGLHYLELVSIIVTAGAILGVVVGVIFGRMMVALYTQYFHFPSFDYRLDASVVAKSLGITFAAALVGTLTTVRRVTRLPPATAMQPEAPPTYRPTLVERLGVGALFGTAGRMVLRELLRRPVRTSLSVMGVALSLAMMVTGRFGYDSVDALMDTQFEGAQREDLTVTFLEPAPGRARSEIAAIPGVLRAEPTRAVPARIRSGQYVRDAPILGRPVDSDLARTLEWPPSSFLSEVTLRASERGARFVPLPNEGIMLSAKLAEILHVAVGDHVTLEILEGNREKLDVAVTALVSDLFGLQAYLTLPALLSLLDEQDAISGVLLAVDHEAIADVERRLQDLPRVATVTRRETMLARFTEQTAQQMWVTTLILTIFAATIAVGVVYNAARIALSMRARDLASLRVLGFTRHEISAVLLGELAAYVVLAIPFGLVFGTWLTKFVMATTDLEYFRMPVAISERTYAFALAITALAAAVAAWIVRRRVDHLDLIAVLKTRE